MLRVKNRRIHLYRRTVYVFSTDIGMEFGIKKCDILTMKRGKIVKSEGIKVPDGEVMK